MSQTKMTRADGYPVVKVTNTFLCKIHYRLRARLPMWVIYHPTTVEYYGQWVARMHVTLPEPKPTRFTMTHDSLEELRYLLPPGLQRLHRDPQDVPEIVEVWL